MAKPAGKFGAKPKSLTVDFTGVERGGGGRNPRVDEGDYLLQVVDYSVRGKKGEPAKKHIAWVTVIKDATAGHEKWIGRRFTHRTTLMRENLWSLRGWVEDLLGPENVPSSAVDLPLAKIAKKKPTIGASMVDDEYQDKPTSKIAGTFPAAEWEEVKSSTSSDDDEDEDEEEDEEEELETEEEDEDEEDEEEDDEDEEEEEEDEEEEEEKPAKKSKKEKPAKKAKKEKKTRKAKKPVVEEDDDEDDEDELDLDDL